METENMYAKQTARAQYELANKFLKHREATDKLSSIRGTFLDEDLKVLRSKVSRYLEITNRYGGNLNEDLSNFTEKLVELRDYFDGIKQRKASLIMGESPLTERLLEGSYLTFGEPGNKTSDSENRIRILSGVRCNLVTSMDNSRVFTEYNPTKGSGIYDSYFGFNEELQKKVMDRTITKEEFTQALERKIEEDTGFRERQEAVLNEIKNTPYLTSEEVEAKKPLNLLKRLIQKRLS